AFLVLLYLFIWRIVRSAARDVRSSQESMILSPQQAQSLGLVTQPGSSAARQLTVGRGANNDLTLDNNEFASARHARIEPRRDGVYVEDIGSTNGTFVNGLLLTREHRLEPGDVVRIGETYLRV